MRTPLYEAHTALGGRIVDFAGWELPVQYEGIIKEHEAVRTGAGMFDVSHMGQLWIEGDGAFEYLQRLCTNDMSRLLLNKWVYSPVCYEHGGTVDDIIAYPREGGALVCVNASNTQKDFEWFSEHCTDGLKVENHSERYAQIALQGPNAKSLIPAVPQDKIILKPATGYTGERGCELYVAPENAATVWDALLSAGAVPCGLGARDSLRMEAAFPLYGHEITEDISPLEGGLSRFVRFDKDDFIGREALLERQNDPSTRILAGLRSDGRIIPRQGCAVLCGGAEVGVVTSGGPGIHIGGQIAMALINPCEGELSVVVRNKPEPMQRVELPFYKVSKG